MILDIFMTNACKKSKKMRQQMLEIVKVSRRKKERLNFQMRDCGTQKRWQIFEEHFSDSWQVYAQRDTAYYQTMILERQSEKGGVRLMRENGVLKGFYAYALEEGLEVREPLYLNQFEGEFERSMQMLLDKSNIRKVDQNENRSTAIAENLCSFK